MRHQCTECYDHLEVNQLQLEIVSYEQLMKKYVTSLPLQMLDVPPHTLVAIAD